MVRGPVLGVGVVLCPLKDRVSDAGVPQVQRLAKIGGRVSIDSAKNGVYQQQPVPLEVKNDSDGLWQLVKPNMQALRQLITTTGGTRYTAQKWHDIFQDECAASVSVVVCAFGVELAAILGYQCQADESGADKIGKFGVQKN